MMHKGLFYKNSSLLKKEEEDEATLCFFHGQSGNTIFFLAPLPSLLPPHPPQNPELNTLGLQDTSAKKGLANCSSFVIS